MIQTMRFEQSSINCTEMSEILGNFQWEKEEHFGSKRRCRRCNSFYTEEQHGSCHYHPGSFTAERSQSLKVGWSCCSKFNKEYLLSKAVGCRFAPFHEEDQSFADTIRRFPFAPADKREEGPSVHNKTCLPAYSEPPESPQEDEHYFVHTVSRVDTLAGIALRYKTTRETIKKVNRMYNDLVWQRDFLWIPKTGDSRGPAPAQALQPQKEDLIRVFALTSKCTREEASFYLSENNWDMKLSLQNWHEDATWSSPHLKYFP